MTDTSELRDPFAYRYFSQFQVDRAPSAERPLKLCVLLGSPDISGGTYAIFQHVQHAMAQGADVTVITHFPRSDARKDWHPALSMLRFATFEEVADETFDIAIATWWRTVFYLPRVRARHFVYFVQSVESRFYATHDPGAATLAATTYELDIPVVTVALWLQAFLAFEHGRPSFLVPYGIDKQRYLPFGATVAERQPGTFRVLVEGAMGVPMKNVERTIELAREGGADEVWLLTPTAVEDVEGVDRVFSRVPIDLTGPVYRSCDVLVKLSMVEGMYGPPLEMFHTGGTVVTYDVTGSEEYIEHGRNGLVVTTGDEDGVVAAVAKLKSDPDLLAALKHGALETASRWPDWSRSSAEFWRVLCAVHRRPPPMRLSHTLAAVRGVALDVP